MHASLAHANRNFHYSQACRPPTSEAAGAGPQHPKHVWRAEIVLLSADGVGTNEIMRRTGKSKTCVWRWQERFMEAGYDSLLQDKTRPSRIPPLGLGIPERVVTLTQTAPPTEATHWTSAMMAKVVDISASSVQRIWRVHFCSRTG
jgi:transposase